MKSDIAIRSGSDYAIVMHYRRLRLAGASYFFTVVTHRRRPIFAEPEAVDALRTAFRTVRARHHFEITAIVVLPDHIHAIWTLPGSDANYPTRWRLIKAETSRLLHRHGTKGQIWQARYWEHCLRDERDLRNHLDYIHYNPVKHGLAMAAADWPWSSFRLWQAAGLYPNGWGASDPGLSGDVGRE